MWFKMSFKTGDLNGNRQNFYYIFFDWTKGGEILEVSLSQSSAFLV